MDKDLSKPAINSVSLINNPYIKAATSENTRLAYRSDIRHFENWGGKLPSSSEAIIQYLQEFATILNPRTLSRRIIAIKHWHTYQGFPDPTVHPAIQKTLVGIMRLHGKPKEKARPLSLGDLLTIVTFLEQENSFTAIRDNALLQLGYFGAFRRSELVKINHEYIEWKNEGIYAKTPIRTTKT